MLSAAASFIWISSSRSAPVLSINIIHGAVPGSLAKASGQGCSSLSSRSLENRGPLGVWQEVISARKLVACSWASLRFPAALSITFGPLKEASINFFIPNYRYLNKISRSWDATKNIPPLLSFLCFFASESITFLFVSLLLPSTYLIQFSLKKS